MEGGAGWWTEISQAKDIKRACTLLGMQAYSFVANIMMANGIFHGCAGKINSYFYSYAKPSFSPTGAVGYAAESDRFRMMQDSAEINTKLSPQQRGSK